MKIFVILMLSVIGYSSVSQSRKAVSRTSTEKIQFEDTIDMVNYELNQTFSLNQDKGLKKFLGKSRFNYYSKNGYGQIYISNKKRTEFASIRLINLGGIKINSFEIGKYKSYSGEEFKSSFNNFSTEKGINLGLSEKNFLKLSGELPYEVTTKKNKKTYRFRTKKLTNGIGIYDSIFIFENNKLVHFTFASDNLSK